MRHKFIHYSVGSRLIVNEPYRLQSAAWITEQQARNRTAARAGSQNGGRRPPKAEPCNQAAGHVLDPKAEHGGNHADYRHDSKLNQ